MRKSVCTAPELATYVAAALPTAVRLHRERCYDINHTHFIFPDGVVARALQAVTGLPYVITAHGSDVPGYNPDRFKTWHRALAPMWTRVVRGAARIVCPSEHLGQLVHRRDPVDFDIVPNGFDPDRFSATRQRENRVLAVSRLFPRKGIQYVIEALDNLPPDWELSVVGDGPHLPALRALADERGARVRFHGWLEHDGTELQDLYETSRVFVLPSEVENFPVVLLEAMAAGLAIVTTDSTGCAEAVGDAGVLVPARDAEAIRQAVDGLIRSPKLCDDLGRRGRLRMQRNFGWSSVTARYEALYGACAVEQALAAAPA